MGFGAGLTQSARVRVVGHMVAIWVAYFNSLRGLGQMVEGLGQVVGLTQFDRVGAGGEVGQT